MALPYPNPDPITDQWDAFAMKRNLEYLDAKSNSAVSNPNFQTVLFRAVGAPFSQVEGTTAETTIFGAEIQGDVILDQKTMLATFQGLILNNTGGSKTITFKVYYGGQLFGTYAFAGISASATQRGFSIETGITGVGVGLQYSWGEAVLTTPGVSGTSETASEHQFSCRGTASVDTSAVHDLELSVEHSSAVAGLVTQVFVASCRLY